MIILYPGRVFSASCFYITLNRNSPTHTFMKKQY